MKQILKTVLCLLFVVQISDAQETKTAKPLGQSSPADVGLPPLIDRESFFGSPEIARAQISPNGKFITFIKPWKGTRNIWVKGINEPFSDARLLTTEAKRPIAGYFWSF